MSKTIVIAGATGLVGTHMISSFLKQNYNIRILTRKKLENIGNLSYYQWDPSNLTKESLEKTAIALTGTDIIINLAGSSIAKGRFSKSHKNKILNSRISALNHLIESFKITPTPPLLWAQASALGYYGNTGENEITETGGSGNFFLSNVCVQWENKLINFQKKNKKLKIIIMRFGLVLAYDAPAWKKMIMPIKLGLGGPMGKGKQWYSWIDADEIPSALMFLIEKKTTGGIFNFSSPSPIRQFDLVRAASKILNRPSFFPNPSCVLKIILGQGADELLLASCKAYPKNLIDAGYEFQQKTIESELKKILK